MTPLDALAREAAALAAGAPRRRGARRRRGRSRARDADLQRLPLLRGLLRGLPGDDAPARVRQGRRPLPRQPVPQLRRLPARLPVRAAARVRRQRAAGDGAGARDRPTPTTRGRRRSARSTGATGLTVALALGGGAGAVPRCSRWRGTERSVHAPLAGNFYAVFPHNLLVGDVRRRCSCFAVLGARHRRGALLARRRAGRGIGAGGGEATRDVLRLKYLDGGHGEGCNDADDALHAVAPALPPLHVLRLPALLRGDLRGDGLPLRARLARALSADEPAGRCSAPPAASGC